MKKIIALLLILGIPKMLTAQPYGLDSIVKDFNNDKINDKLYTSFNNGSYVSDHVVSIINGKTKEEFSLVNEGGYSSFIRFIRVPDNLTLKKNSVFLDTIKKRILPKKRDRIDGSLKWLISGALSLKRLDSHAFFDLIAYPKNDWQPTIPYFPKKSYYIDISGDSLNTLEPPVYKEDLKNKNTKSFLAYYPRASYFTKKTDKLTSVAKNKEYEIYKTMHAVFVKKEDIYKWVFISDARVVGAPDRHSWTAIKQVQLIDKYLIIHHNVPPNPIYNIQIVNIETQRVGRLKFDPSYKLSYKGMHTFEIKEDYLIFGEMFDEEAPKKISLKKMFNALDTF